MARKQIRISRRMLFICLMLGGFIFLFAPQKLTNTFQLGFARLFNRPLGFGRSFVLDVRARPTGDYVSRREYDRLRNLLTNTIEQLGQAHNTIKDLSQLRSIRPDFQRMAIITADVTTVPDGSKTELIINRGRLDGLAIDQFVVADNSVIGRISAVSPRTAEVRLFTDPESRIPIEIAGLSVNRIMQGIGNNSAGILDLQVVEHKIKQGDAILVRKEPGFLDSPMIIARISRYERGIQHPMLWDVIVEPVCDMAKLRRVAVIVLSP